MGKEPVSTWLYRGQFKKHSTFYSHANHYCIGSGLHGQSSNISKTYCYDGISSKLPLFPSLLLPLAYSTVCQSSAPKKGQNQGKDPERSLIIVPSKQREVVHICGFLYELPSFLQSVSAFAVFSSLLSVFSLTVLPPNFRLSFLPLKSQPKSFKLHNA